MSLKIARWLHQRGISRGKFRGGLIHRHLGDGILETDLWSLNSKSVAKAWLIGVPITMIPFLPFQSFIAVPLAVVFRANVPITYVLQWASNPFTAFLQLPACYYFGCLILRQPPSQSFHELSRSFKGVSDFGGVVVQFLKDVWAHPVIASKTLVTQLFGDSLPQIWSLSVKEILFPLYFGSLVLGIVLAVIGYFLIRAYWPTRVSVLEKKQVQVDVDILD